MDIVGDLVSPRYVGIFWEIVVGLFIERFVQAMDTAAGYKQTVILSLLWPSRSMIRTTEPIAVRLV